jgi:hypothetical protein
MAKLQHTTPTLGDCIVHDDDSVTIDGVPSPESVVSVANDAEGNPQIRLDVGGTGIIDANSIPFLGDVKVTREPGWQGNLGYRVVLLDWDENATPNAIALAVYNEPDGNNYWYTTGAMLWDSVAEEWYVTCPAGFEPGQNDIHMGFLYGSSPFSAFTMHSQWDEQTFAGGGDWETVSATTYDSRYLLHLAFIAWINANR